MNSPDFTGAVLWGGRPVARRAADAEPRGRVVTTGTICSSGTIEVGGSPSFCCVLFDGSGEIGLLFLGRSSVSGVTVGARCTVEGTARMGSDHLVLWNPIYRLEPPDEDDGNNQRAAT